MARGSREEAVTLATEVVALSEHTDSPLFQGYARMDLGHVLHGAGELETATIAFEQAACLFEHKGDVMDARKADALMGT